MTPGRRPNGQKIVANVSLRLCWHQNRHFESVWYSDVMKTGAHLEVHTYNQMMSNYNTFENGHFVKFLLIAS